MHKELEGSDNEQEHSSGFGNGGQSLIWVACAHLINWLLVHNWYLVALVSGPISDGS